MRLKWKNETFTKLFHWKVVTISFVFGSIFHHFCYSVVSNVRSLMRTKGKCVRCFCFAMTKGVVVMSLVYTHYDLDQNRNKNEKISFIRIHEATRAYIVELMSMPVFCLVVRIMNDVISVDFNDIFGDTRRILLLSCFSIEIAVLVMSVPFSLFNFQFRSTNESRPLS